MAARKITCLKKMNDPHRPIDFPIVYAPILIDDLSCGKSNTSCNNQICGDTVI